MEQRITMSTNIPPQSGRKARRAIRAAVIAAAEFHHDSHIHKHFESGAASLYGYGRRSSEYVKQTRRKNPSWRPLMRTGDTMRSVLNEHQVRATSTRGAVLVMKAALPGFSGRFKDKAGPGFLSKQQERQLARVEEIRAITTEEIAVLAKVEERVFEAEMRSTTSMRRLF